MSALRNQPLSVTHPELVMELVDTDPDTVSMGMEIKVKWRCNLNHIYLASIYSRSNLKSGCPFCSGNKILPGFNDLATTNPELAKELVDADPTKISKGLKVKVEWKCLIGHEWSASIADRMYKNAGCPYCIGKRVLSGFNDLATTHPELAKELVDADPTAFSRGSNKIFSWKCELGHIWRASIGNRTNVGSGCPICSGTKVLAGFNDLATTHPELAKELVDADPTKISKGSSRNFSWKCELGHLWKTQVITRTTGRGCPICSGKKVLAGFNDLATTHPEVAKELVDADPTKISKGSNRNFSWKCELGHLWKAQVITRTGGSGCPICSGKKVLAGFNDLATTHPEVAKELVDGDPKTFSKGAEKSVKWKCELGHNWFASIGSRTNMGSGCPICSGKKVLAGFNDLATTHPEVAKELVDADPTKFTSGSNLSQTWRCSFGHVWRTAISHRTSTIRSTGCPSCSKYGFDPSDKGYLYLIEHQNWKMLQIGITNNPDQRLLNHSALGWKLIEIRGPIDGLLTRKLETGILQMLKANGADLANEKIAGKFDGYSEAWSKAIFDVRSIKELIRLTEEFEES